MVQYGYIKRKCNLKELNIVPDGNIVYESGKLKLYFIVSPAVQMILYHFVKRGNHPITGPYCKKT